MDVQTFDNLIDGYFEDQLNPEQLAAFNHALLHSPQARQRFWEHAHLQTYLVELAERKVGEAASHRIAAEDAIAILAQLEELADPALREVEPEPEPLVLRGPSAFERAHARFDRLSMRIGPMTRALAAAAVLGIVLLLGWQLLFNPAKPAGRQIANNPDPALNTPAPATRAHATLVRSFDAQWQGNAPKTGQMLDRSASYQLTHGAIELQMDTGALVALRAPVTFAVHDDNKLKLDAGQACAFVPDSAIGFEIQTPQGRVVDLGTEFGVRVDEQGQSEVVVFKGLVQANANDTDEEPVMIPANFGSKVSAGSPVTLSLKSIDQFQTRDFVRDWDEVIYHPEIVGGVYHRQAPASLVDDAFEADYIQVIAEQRGVVLDQPLDVTQLSAGFTQLTGKEGKRTLEAGTKVNSFLVHLDRPANAAAIVTRQVELKFPGEVLGVIKNNKLMLATDLTLGDKNTRYPKIGESAFRSSEDPYDSKSVDMVRLDTDGRTLTVSFLTFNVDAIRVIVRNTDDQQPVED